MVLLEHLASGFQVSAEPDELLTDAASRMRFSDIGCVPVMGETGLVGILTERDLTRAIADGVDLRHSTVSDYMTPDPRVADGQTDVRTAAQMMISAGIRHLPVFESGRMVAVLSMRDLLVGTCWPEEPETS